MAERQRVPLDAHQARIEGAGESFYPHSIGTDHQCNMALVLKGLQLVICKADGLKKPLDVHPARVTRVRERIHLHLTWERPHYQTTFPQEGLCIKLIMTDGQQ